MKEMDALKNYTALRDSIFAEREKLIARLREIDDAIGPQALRGQDNYGPRTPTGRTRNEMSLKDTVIEVLKGKTLTKREVLDAVIAKGYVFSTHDPLNSLGVILYGQKKLIKSERGRFSLA